MATRDVYAPAQTTDPAPEWFTSFVKGIQQKGEQVNAQMNLANMLTGTRTEAMTPNATFGALADPYARPPVATSQKKSSSSSQSKSSSSTPSDNPEKYVLDVLLATLTPEIGKMGMAAFQQTGQIPDPKAVLGNLMQRQTGNAPQPGQVAPTAQAPQPGQMAPAATAPQPGQSAPASIEQPVGKYQQIAPSSLFGFGGAKMDAEGNLIEQKPGVVGGLLSGLFNKKIDAQARSDMDKIANIQKLTGTEPMQQSKREELGMEYDKAIKVKEYELAAKQAEEGNLKPEHIFNKFQAASIPFITARDAHVRVEESAKDTSGASDLALIFNYMKVLDPGSTVREGEFATAENSRGVPETIRNMYNKFSKGGKMSPKQRADFLKTSRRIFTGMERQQKKTTEEFKGLAKRNNIDFSKVVQDTGIALEESGIKVVQTGSLPDGTKVEKLSDGSIRKAK